MTEVSQQPVPEDVSALLALSLIPGIGPRLQAQLMDHFGTAAAVLQQSADQLTKVAGIGTQTAMQITSGDHQQSAVAMLQQCRQNGVHLLTKGGPRYPEGLKSLSDGPMLLYSRGDLQPCDDLAIAIVGARRCTQYGRRQAERLAGSLVRAGFTVVSGLARGIDTAAHRGALNAGGRTVAVMATGVREIYPPENAELAVEISHNGSLLSEFPLDQKPRPGLFPQRNRIISGMCLAVIIVEATRNSGALHTARHAMEQGREVFALPGPVDSIASEGCHELIREGVTLVRNCDDVLAELGPLSSPRQSQSDNVVHNPREMTLNEQEKELLNLISTNPVHIDEVLRTTELEMSRVLSTITVLEVKRFIRRLPGGMLVRNV